MCHLSVSSSSEVYAYVSIMRWHAMAMHHSHAAPEVLVQEPYDLGDAYAQVAIGTDDVYKTAESIRKAGGTITKEPQEIASIGTKIMATTDPDGWKVVFVDNADFLRELE